MATPMIGGATREFLVACVQDRLVKAVDLAERSKSQITRNAKKYEILQCQWALKALGAEAAPPQGEVKPEA